VERRHLRKARIPRSEAHMKTHEIQSNSRAGYETDRRKQLRGIFDLLLPDGLMIVLAVVMVPVVLLPLFVDLAPSAAAALIFVDYAVLSIFIIEYVSKTLTAPNILKHIINPWHLLDLVVIAVPLVNLLPVVSLRWSNSSLILRLLRIVRVAAVGSRAVDRRVEMAVATRQAPASEVEPLQIQVMEGEAGNIHQDVCFDEVAGFIASPSQTWIDISSICESDFDRLSAVLGIPRILLESELRDESYPRVDYFESYSLIFAKVADIQISRQGSARLEIDRKGILIVCQGANIITLSKARTDIFARLTEKARKSITSEEPLLVTILYSILQHILEKDKAIIAALEQELMILESIPLEKLPDNFLEITFYLRKEANHVVPSLLHLKEIISVIMSKRVPLEGFAERHRSLFDILGDEADYLHETASSARDNLQSLVDLYINTTSYHTNKVMRIIAVITSLSIIPAAMGLLGSNIAGNPWNIQLWQVLGLLGVLMMIMGWVFYRMGWLKA
jgi:Mg2+ and Co2+ transporter CorA